MLQLASLQAEEEYGGGGYFRNTPPPAGVSGLQLAGMHLGKLSNGEQPASCHRVAQCVLKDACRSLKSARDSYVLMSVKKMAQSTLLCSWLFAGSCVEDWNGVNSLVRHAGEQG